MHNLEEIQATYGAELTLFCRRMVYQEAVAAEIVQDAFAAMLQTTEPIHHVRGWLYRVARNRCLDVLRTLGREERLSAIQSSPAQLGRGPLIDPLTTPAGKAIKAERIERVGAALNELDDDLRSIILLRFWQGLQREELAEALGLSRSGVDHRLSRAVRALAIKLASLR